MIVLLFAVLAYLMYSLLGGASKQNIDTMRENAVSFAKVVLANSDSFHNFEVVYLNEVIEEELLKNISNPFGDGYCDGTESKVEMKEGKLYVTLKCGKYLIEAEEIKSKENMDIYIVGEWSEKKSNKSDQKKVLYNCLKDDKEIYSEYKEDLQMISRINKDFQTDLYFVDDASSVCKPVNKNFYRTKELFS